MAILKRWNGTTWEDISSGALIIKGGLSGRLIREIVLASDQASVEFGSLDSAVDGIYTVEIDAEIVVADYFLMQVNNITSGYESTSMRTPGTVFSHSSGVRYIYNDAGTHQSAVLRVSDKTVIATAVGKDSTVANYVTTCILPSLTTITSIKLVGDASGIFKTGSVVRLYGSNSPVNLIDATVRDHSLAVSDKFLQVCEAVTIDYTNATSVPLHISTAEGIYDLVIEGDATVTPSNNNSATLTPNNSNLFGVTSSSQYTVPYNMSGSYSAPGSFGVWNSGTPAGTEGIGTIGIGTVVLSRSVISTKTTAKGYESRHTGRRTGTQPHHEVTMVQFLDTTTSWTSLGTITFPFAQTGKIYIKRIL